MKPLRILWDLELEGISFFNIDGYENMTPEEKGKVSQ